MDWNQSAPSGKRAYAMASCLTDLGLRANEVGPSCVSKTLIGWDRGIIRLAANKSRRTDVLPLPPETGRAIAAYLSTERPVTANRAVFVRHVAPYDDPIGPGVVRKIIIAASGDVVGRIRASTSSDTVRPAGCLQQALR